MKIHKFELLIAKREGKLKQLSIAQIKEVRKCINDLLSGKLNKLIKEL